MPDLLDALFSIVFGMSMILFRKSLVRRATKWRSRFFQFNIFRFNSIPAKKQQEMVELGHRFQEVLCAIIGSIFVVFGLLELFGVIHLRR
jgi:hypothetical protein